jgi:predicted MFS family arabinose efflux permease
VRSATESQVRRLFALPGFGRLSIAYALNELAWFVGTLSLSVLVYRHTGSALGSAAFFLCSQALPALVAPMVVGRLDRMSPRRLLPSLYGIEAVLFGVLAWLTHRFLLGPVLGIVVLDGVVALSARSLSSGARTEILKPAGLVREGGALTNVMFSVAYLVGPLLGGAIAALGGTVTALIVNSGIFAVIGLSLLSRTVPDSIVHDGPERGRLRAGLAYARANAAIANVLSVQAIAFALFSIATPIEVVLCIHVLHAGSAGYGGLLAAWGGGAVLGSLIFARWRHSALRVLLIPGAVCLAIGFGLMSISPDIVVALVGGAVAGLGNGVTATGFVVELTAITPQSWVALVTSLNQSLGVLAPGAGIALGGGFAALFGVRAAFGIAGAGCLVVAGLVAWLLAPSRMPAPVTDADPADGARRAAAGASHGEGVMRPESDTPTLA